MPETRTPLEVGECSLAIGEHSVGFPFSRTGNELVEAYLKLIVLVREDRPDYFRREDVEELATETGLEQTFIENRVKAHLSTISA